MPLAQFNIARARWPLQDERMKVFNDNTERMKTLAARSPGFIWQLSGDGAKQIIWDDPQMTWTVSLWRDAEALANFAFRTVHRQFFQRRAEWFPVLDHVWFALWEIEEGRNPTLAEALEKKARFDRQGPSEDVFGWERFPHLRALRDSVA
ncbi:MAG: DUF3291 domain-containing protein [Paracoccaceae bacterium]